MRKQMSGWLLAGFALGICGCQSWSQVGQGIPGGSRVAPPGTGTYQVPSSYYNNGGAAKTGAVSSTGAPSPTNNNIASASASRALPSTGSTTSGASPAVTTANWQLPTVDQMRSGINNTASAALNDASNRANQVVQTGTSRAAAAVDKYTDPLLGAAAPASNPATRSISDAPKTDEPQLDWQPPQ